MSTQSFQASSWHSYPKIYNLGHKFLKELFDGPVIIQEKVDGSQFSFGIFDQQLKFKSKSCELQDRPPEKMFAGVVDYITGIQGRLIPGWTYRAELVSKPKHNTLCYGRVPKNFLVLFDVEYNEGEFAGPIALREIADALEIDCTPLLAAGDGVGLHEEDLRALLDTISFLGGQKVEGIVIKNYGRCDPYGHTLMGKFVSEKYKEVHRGDWKVRNPGAQGVIEAIIHKYKTPARWDKAVIHLRESNRIEDTPRDIGLLVVAVPLDVKEECEDEIRDALWEWAWPKIRRGLCGGMAEWYKDKLLEKQFEDVQ